VGTSFKTPTVDFSGTGAPGGFLRLVLGGKLLNTNPIRIGSDGKWVFPGIDLSKLDLSPSDYTLEIQALDPRDTTRVLGSNTVQFSLPGFSAGSLNITEPTSGNKLPAGTFILRGMGSPGQEVEVFEDGASLGTVKVSTDGTWSLAVPSPASGSRTYKAAGGGMEAFTRLSIAEAQGQAQCTGAFSLSMQDGSTVNKPFRFGGVGTAPNYTIMIKRQGRVIGTKVVKLDSTCGWSYTSNPGSGSITYEVRQTSAASGSTPLSTINLKVR